MRYLTLAAVLVIVIVVIAVSSHELLFLNLPTWQSHIIMAVVAGTVVAIASYSVLRRQHALYQRLEETQRRLMDYTAKQEVQIVEREHVENTLRVSEERLRLALDAANMGYWDWDILSNQVIVDRHHEQLFGIEPGTFLETYEAFLQLIHPEDRASVQQAVANALQASALYQQRYRIIWSDGSIHWMESQAQVHRNNVGEPVRLVGVAQDVTARKQTEEALRQSEAAEREQRTFAQSLRDSIAMLTSTLDLESVMNRVLENAQHIVPHESASIVLLENDHVRIAYWRNYPPEMVAFFQQSQFLNNIVTFREITRTGKPFLIAETNASPDWVTLDSAKWIRSYLGVPIRAHSKIIGILNLDSAVAGYFTPDHAERVQVFADQAGIAIENAQLYAKVNRYAEELEQRVAERTQELTLANQRLLVLDRLKNKFITDISHELRTPVANLNMRLYLLEHDTADKQAEHIAILNSQLTRLNELLESVLDFSQLDDTYEGNVGLEHINLNVIVQQTVDAYRTRAEAAHLRLTFYPGDNLPPIAGKADYVYRIMANLLTNAISYTPSGRIDVRTYVNAGRSEACLDVQDTGIGIEPEDMSHLFERFYRGKHIGSSAIPGAGLGLTLVQELVELLRGQIEVESEPGIGTLFRIRLPIESSLLPSTITFGQE